MRPRLPIGKRTASRGKRNVNVRQLKRRPEKLGNNGITSRMSRRSFIPNWNPRYRDLIMTTKPPPNRRKFVSEWDEIEYLYHKILHWFYPVRDRGKALRFCERLEELLRKVASRHEAILGESCWSLLYEVRGDLPKAIASREHEIKLIRQLWKISKGTPGEEVAL